MYRQANIAHITESTRRFILKTKCALQSFTDHALTKECTYGLKLHDAHTTSIHIFYMDWMK